MCGIAGLWKNHSDQRETLNHEAIQMASNIEHRGPNSSGFWSDPAIGLAISHQRLSILDLSEKGNQPFISANGRYIVSYNGEIYNHKSLRRKLLESSQIKREWIGNSDTETLLACIEAWGLRESLNKFEGMFAFALWDKHLRVLHLARDRFGEKPLYWGEKVIENTGQKCFVFGSELSAFRAINGTKNNINHNALFIKF